MGEENEKEGGKLRGTEMRKIKEQKEEKSAKSQEEENKEKETTT